MRLVPSIERALRNADERRRRRQAEDAIHYQKTQLLCQNEATPDGILVVDADKVVSFNRRFQQMFSIPDDVMTSRSFQAIGSWMTDRVTAPDRWLARHAELAAMPDELGLDEIGLNDGRTFERYSGPVKDEEGHFFGTSASITRSPIGDEQKRRCRSDTRLTAFFTASTSVLEGETIATFLPLRASNSPGSSRCRWPSSA